MNSYLPCGAVALSAQVTSHPSSSSIPHIVPTTQRNPQNCKAAAARWTTSPGVPTTSPAAVWQADRKANSASGHVLVSTWPISLHTSLYEPKKKNNIVPWPLFWLPVTWHSCQNGPACLCQCIIFSKWPIYSCRQRPGPLWFWKCFFDSIE